MGEIIGERRQEAERLRGYFEVQLLFAQTLAARTSRSLGETCLRFTNLHRRFGLGRAGDGPPSPEWTRFVEGLEARASGRDRVEWILACFADATPEAGVTRRFGCFNHEPPDADGVIRIHFGNRDIADGCGPLARTKAERRMAELREMFESIRAHHPNARAVRGGSWLYNLDAYRRLFPPAYTASAFELEGVRLDGTSSWGQVLDFRGAVKPAIAEALLANIGTVDIAAPWRAFPLRALGALSPIEPFYAFYARSS